MSQGRLCVVGEVAGGVVVEGGVVGPGRGWNRTKAEARCP